MVSLSSRTLRIS